nr:anaphase-promoting complex subunit 11 [Ipomoea batatas]
MSIFVFTEIRIHTITFNHDLFLLLTRHFSIRACCPAPPSAARRRLICFFHFQNSSLEGWKIMPFKAITQTPVSGRRSNTGMYLIREGISYPWRGRGRERWHAVASWTWDAQDETCGICRMAFDGCCPDCKLPGDDCPLIWGACNHAFHLHCILKWVNSQTSQAHCPMCRREWQFKG